VVTVIDFILNYVFCYVALFWYTYP